MKPYTLMLALLGALALTSEARAQSTERTEVNPLVRSLVERVVESPDRVLEPEGRDSSRRYHKEIEYRGDSHGGRARVMARVVYADANGNGVIDGADSINITLEDGTVFHDNGLDGLALSGDYVIGVEGMPREPHRWDPDQRRNVNLEYFTRVRELGNGNLGSYRPPQHEIDEIRAFVELVKQHANETLPLEREATGGTGTEYILMLELGDGRQVHIMYKDFDPEGTSESDRLSIHISYTSINEQGLDGFVMDHNGHPGESTAGVPGLSSLGHLVRPERAHEALMSAIREIGPYLER